ncbi:hypothetical protein KUCAC02_034304 [Chaenocephalus aceratus]|nr:hypothetical protein KUCAC02_034304 [Chaenocephalus aceratus]
MGDTEDVTFGSLYHQGINSQWAAWGVDRLRILRRSRRAEAAPQAVLSSCLIATSEQTVPLDWETQKEILMGLDIDKVAETSELTRRQLTF